MKPEAIRPALQEPERSKEHASTLRRNHSRAPSAASSDSRTRVTCVKVSSLSTGAAPAASGRSVDPDRTRGVRTLRRSGRSGW